MRDFLKQACRQGHISQLDLQLGLFLEKLAGKETPELLLAGVLAANAVSNGHVCRPLTGIAELPLDIPPEMIPEPTSWAQALLATPVVGRPGESTPLILDADNRLYLYRYYQYEQQIAADLLKRARGMLEIRDQQQARFLLDQLFSDNEEINYQQLSAALALLKRLVVISGGPGTGKTYTVARILGLIQALTDKPLRIALAAPTGKAAARLEESIRKARESLPAEFAEKIPEQAQTLHRLLGFRPDSDDFRYNGNNPLHFDVVVLDEASMIDVVMMSGLIRALPATSRLILLGDHNQLASVEAGSLFGDLCGTGVQPWSSQLCEQLHILTGAKNLPQAEAPGTMADSVILLRTSHRFKDTSGIGSLALAVNNGSVGQVNTIRAQEFTDLQIKCTTGADRNHWLRQQVMNGFQRLFTADSVEEAFAAMEKFRFLCAVRKGPAGVEGINSLAEQVLHQAGLISGDTDWYRGKPIIIRRNHYEMQLFNGDTGILWHDETGTLRAWFKHPDNSLHSVTPARLPEHDSAYAITIHKAQGSEFERVLLLLPEEKSRVISRELLYTGITRAKEHLSLCCDQKILSTAVKQRTKRHSGLEDKLWQE